MPPSSLPPSPLRHSLSRKHKAYSPYHQSAPHFHRKCGALFGIMGARRGMFSFDTKREPEKCGASFRLPPPYLWTPPTPQRAKGCSPLTILKKKSKHKKASAAPVGAIALTLFFASPSIAPQSLRDRFPFLSPAVTSSPGRGKSALSGERAPAPSAALSQKAALQMPFAVTTSPVKMGFRKVRRLS